MSFTSHLPGSICALFWGMLSSLHHEEEKRALIIFKIFYNTLVHWSTDKPFSCSMENSVKRRCATRSWESESRYTTHSSLPFHWTLITYPWFNSHWADAFGRSSYWTRLCPWRRLTGPLFPFSKKIVYVWEELFSGENRYIKHGSSRRWKMTHVSQVLKSEMDECWRNFLMALNS